MALLGYAHLLDRYALPVSRLSRICRLKDALPDRRVRDEGGQTVEEFGPTYAPGSTLVDHLRFALRYEGLNLEVLSLLFERTGAVEIQAALEEQPTSAAARRLGFLYEWLTGRELELSEARLPTRARFVPALDEALQFGLAHAASPRNQKYRVIDNLPGTRAFCPLTRRTPYLESMVQKGLQARARAMLAKYDARLVRRAASFLYLAETQSSFEVERVRPPAPRAQRFTDLLRQAEADVSLSEDRFVELQNAVVDPRSMEASYRTTQNWLGTDLGHRQRIDYVPPRPEDARALMDGLVAMAERLRVRPGIDRRDRGGKRDIVRVRVHPSLHGWQWPTASLPHPRTALGCWVHTERIHPASVGGHPRQPRPLSRRTRIVLAPAA